MNYYLSTFISGFQDLIKKILKQEIKDVEIKLILDGAIIYKTNSNFNKINQLKFFNNTFAILKEFPNLKSKNYFSYMMKSILKENLEAKIKPFLKNSNKTFRIIASDENRFVSSDKNLLIKVENKISHETKNKLRFQLRNPNLEFWFLKRREKIGFFLLRLTKNKLSKLEKGELRPELAYLLCYLAEPNKKDIFLDPFSGHGSIPIMRAKYFASNMIFASDEISNYKKYLNKKIKSRAIREKIIPKNLNATKLNFFYDNYIHKIVTDPPWGEYEKLENISEFYKKILIQFERILKKKGILVLMTSRKQEFETELKKISNFNLKEKYNILVSGKKAGVYKIIKN